MGSSAPDYMLGSILGVFLRPVTYVVLGLSGLMLDYIPDWVLRVFLHSIRYDTLSLHGFITDYML